MASTPGSIDTIIRSTWSDGFVVDLSFTPEEAVNGWRIELSFEGEIVNLWNARIVSHVGDRYVIESLDYNASLRAGQTISFGFQASGTDTTIDVDLGPSTPPPPVTVGAANVAAPEGDPAEPGGEPASLLGPLTTVGAQIVNAAGEAVTIEAVNWFGMETSTLVPHGLWARNWQDMMDEMKALGFNAIRLPFSLEAVFRGDEAPNSIDFALNPDLRGLSVLEVLDRIVDYAGSLGMGILLDNHRSAAGPGPNPNGLWYDGGYTEADWIRAWETLATRYGDHPAIIGADLVNEPHGATWDAWASAAERAGNAVLDIAPDWLIVVEGVGQYGGDPYWWGGDLEGVRDRPVVLDQPGKLVYSPHDYPASVFPQPWFFDGSDLFEVFRENWGYIHEEGIAPILLGEFGSKLATEVDRTWAEAITSYLSGDFDGDGAVNPGAQPISFAWWSWNPNSGDTGGVLADDWRTPRPEVLDLLEPFLDDAGTPGPASRLVFTVSLEAASTVPVTVGYRTADGTAIAGVDYVATAGTLTFAPGETSKTVAVTILPDTVAEGNETMFLDLTGPNGTVRATGTLTDDDGSPPPPPVETLVVSDVIVDEDAGFVRLRISLSGPSQLPVSVTWTTRDGSAGAGRDYTAVSDVVEFRPGETVKEVIVGLVDDAVPEALETFEVVLSDAVNARVADGTAVVTVRDGDALPLPSLAVADVTVDEEAASATVRVTLSAPSETAVSVGWATRDGTAKAGSDYGAASGTLEFRPGETWKDVTVALRDDAVAEALETFGVVLSAAVGATIADGTGTVTVRDTDPSAPPPAGLTVSARVVNDWGSGAQVAITLTNEGTTAVDGWELSFNTPAPITQLWGGALSGSSGEVEVDNLSWNARVDPGRSVEIGFLTSAGGIDLAAWLAAADFEVA